MTLSHITIDGGTDDTPIGNIGDSLKVDATATTALPLPTGAATATKQDTGNTSLSSIDTKTPALVSGRQPVDGSGVTQPVSAASLPLPTGAATSANQSTEITSLQLLDDVPTAQNGAFSKGNPFMGQLDDTSTTAATEDNCAVARITPKRAVHTNFRNQAGTEIGTSTNPVRVDPTGTTTQPVSGSVTATISGNATEAELATFVSLALEVASGNNKSLYSLVNTTGSTVKIKIREIKLVNSQNVAVTGVVADINLYRCTSHSSGTALTPLPFDTADSLNGSVTAKTGATITGEAATPLLHMDLSTDEWGPGATDVESQDHNMQLFLPLYFTKPKMKPITLNANEGVTLKCVTNTTTGDFDIHILFTQE